MELKIIEEEEYREFAYKHENFNFMQSIEIANLKEMYGYSKNVLGLFDNEKLVGSVILLKRKVFLNNYEFYAPRGFITNYNNKKYVTCFTNLLSDYVRKNGGFKFVIDPPIIYQIRKNDGSIDQNYIKNDSIVNLLKKLGYKHFGFNLNFESRQVRFVYRKELKNNYEETLTTFSKSTIKNIESMQKNGVCVKLGNELDLDELSSVFEHTAKIKDFSYRPLSYYKNMYKMFKDYMTIYIAYIDVNKFFDNMQKLLKIENSKKQQIEWKMKKEKVGKKLENDLLISNNIIEKYKEKIELAKDMLKNGNTNITIGALLSVKSGNENITLTSGTNEKYLSFGPKYAFYNQHIKDSINEGFKYVNFYGISGNFDTKNKYYGIYELKKGFNGEVVEYIGEFTYVVNKFTNLIINMLVKIKKAIKR